MEERPTLDQIAKAAGVSTKTVSLALRGEPGVSSETAVKVRMVAKELGHRPGKRSRRLGVVTPRANHPSYGALVEHLTLVAEPKRYAIDGRHSDGSIERERWIVNELLRTRADGVILLSPALQVEEIAEIAFAHGDIPIVSLCAEVKPLESHPPNLAFIVVDNEGGARRAVELLRQCGHKRIGYIGGRVSDSNSARKKGYEAALKASDLFDDRYVIDGASNWVDFDTGHSRCKQLLSVAPPIPTAILCYADIIAIGAMRAVIDSGRKIPDDISIIGFDDIPLADFTIPRLTTIVVPRVKQAESALDAIDKLINTKVVESPLPKVFLSTHVIHRQSHGPAPADVQ